MQQPLLPAGFSLKKSTALIGPYGSGKSELSLALARLMARRIGAHGCSFTKVALGDIDVLKPYFRSREVREPLKNEGIALLAPAGALAGSDLPILTPELRGALLDPETLLIIDVGGDPVGARALGSLRDVMEMDTHDLWLVLNKNRPFMETLRSVVEQAEKIQCVTGMELTGIVSNTHMMAETTCEDVTAGIDLAQQVGDEFGVPVCLVGLNQEMAKQLASERQTALLQGIPAIILEHHLNPAFLGGSVFNPRIT